jgi:hypothetical protein
MERGGVSIRVNRNSLHAHLAGGADNAASDFTAIGDEDFVKHA